MPPLAKALAGLLLALAAAWAWYGPLGNGERLIAALEARAAESVAKAELPGIAVRLSRDPLARVAILSGPASDLQREGLGSQKGVSDYVRDVGGIARVRWTDESRDGTRVIPLLLEILGLAAFAYLVGLGLGWLLWGRRRREDFD